MLSLQQLCSLFRPSLLLSQQLYWSPEHAYIRVLPLFDLCIGFPYHCNCSHSVYQSTDFEDNKARINTVINLNSSPFVLNAPIYLDTKLIQIDLTKVYSAWNQSGVQSSCHLYVLPPHQQLPLRTTSRLASNLCCSVACNVSVYLT